jgi:acetamidase/formamidase
VTRGFTRALAPFLGVMGVAPAEPDAGDLQPGQGDALALASTCVDLRVTQVANQTWGVHAVLPDGVIA